MVIFLQFLCKIVPLKNDRFIIPMGPKHKMGLDVKKGLRRFVNNKGADHPAHPQSLISAFVFPYWKASHLDLLQPKFHFFYLVSVNEQAGLNLTL